VDDALPGHPVRYGCPMPPSNDARATVPRRTRITFGLVAAVYAILLCLVLGDILGGYLHGLTPGDPVWHFPYAFTNQVNLLLMAWLALFAVANLGTGSLARAAGRLATEGMAAGLALCQLVTFVTVTCVLNPFYRGEFRDVLSGGGVYLHVYSPVVVMLIFLLYAWPDKATWRAVLGWMGYLLAYVAVVLVVGARFRWRGGEQAYAYGFLDPHTYPSVSVYALVIAGVALAVFGLGLGLLRVKRALDAGLR